MQTLLWASLIFGLLIQRSSSEQLVEQSETLLPSAVINGQNAEPEAVAWMAAVGNETHFLCGGTLIHKRFVLTAAHCIKSQGKLLVALGAYNLLRPVVQYRVPKAEIHRGYSEATGRNDIGLLQLPLDVVFTPQIYPISINLHPTLKREVENADTFDAYGWGRTQAADISKILQRVTLNHYDRRRCNRIAHAPLTSNQICAGSSNRDTCDGDSGGPLIKEVEYNGIRRLTQIGMVSYGLTSCRGLGIYTDVTSYADWIEEKIKEQFPQDSWPSSPTANSDSISPPTETVSYGVDNFGQARLLVEQCGTSRGTRIRGQNHGVPEDAAWIAAVHNEDGFLCLSTVIHRRFVLTTASCIFLEEDLIVKTGAYNLRRPIGEYFVRENIIPDEYSPSKNVHDIGLLRLSRDIQFSLNVYPICIILNPEVKDKVENAYTFDYYRWRYINEAQRSKILQKVTVDHFDRSKCNKMLDVPLLSNQICAAAPIENPHHVFDGPLTKKVIVNGHQRSTQFGIKSFSVASGDRIAVYTDVTSYVDWIEREVRRF